MKKMLTPEERIERLRLLGERLELERIETKTPAQLKRLSDLERILEAGRTVTRTEGRSKPAAA